MPLTAAVFSFPFVVKLAEDGAYQNSCQTYISQTEAAILDDLTFYVRDRYQAQQQGEIWTDGPDRLNDPNFFYTIKDKSGKTLDASEELGTTGPSIPSPSRLRPARSGTSPGPFPPRRPATPPSGTWRRNTPM